MVTFLLFFFGQDLFQAGREAPSRFQLALHMGRSFTA